MTRVALALAAALAAACLESGATELDEVPCPEAGTDLRYDNFGQGFLAAYCQRCHASDAEPRNGAPIGFTFGSRAEVLAHQDRIFVRAAAGNTTMPPGPDDPPRAERDLLAEWLACGAP